MCSPNIPRLTQAAATLITLSQGRITLTRLETLLYLADRASLAETGFPMVSTAFVNTPHGPKSKDVADYPPPISKTGDSLSLTYHPGDDALSDFDVSTLTRLYHAYSNLSDASLVELTQTLPEWIPAPTETPLPIERILSALGFNEETIAALKSLNDHLRAVEQHLAQSDPTT